MSKLRTHLARTRFGDTRRAQIEILVVALALAVALPVGAAPRWHANDDSARNLTTEMIDHHHRARRHHRSTSTTLAHRVPTTARPTTTTASSTLPVRQTAPQTDPPTDPPTFPTTVPSTMPPPPPNVGSSQPLGVPGSWTATFADEFNGSGLDRAKWNTTGTWECCDGGRSNLGNGELDYKTDGANFSFANGALTIQARRESAPGGQGWTSGQLGSKQAFTYGYIEQRGQFPSPAGFLDAFWTWGAPGTNVSGQETDGYEFYSDNHGRVYLTAHTTGGGGCQGVGLGFDPTTGMHTYGTDIEPSGTDWYIDGVHVCHASGHPTQAWNIVDYMTVNASMRAPVAAATTTHAEKIIDYIRVWQH